MYIYIYTEIKTKLYDHERKQRVKRWDGGGGADGHGEVEVEVCPWGNKAIYPIHQVRKNVNAERKTCAHNNSSKTEQGSE